MTKERKQSLTKWGLRIGSGFLAFAAGLAATFFLVPGRIRNIVFDEPEIEVPEETHFSKFVSRLMNAADVDSDEFNNRYVIVDPANGEVVDSYNSPVANSGMAMVENEISVGSKTLYSVYDFSGDEPAYTLIVAEGENREQTIDVNAVVGQSFWDISNFVVVDDNTVVMTAYGNDEPITLTLTLDNGNLVESNSVSALDEYYFTLTQDGLSCAVDSEGIWTVDEKAETPAFNNGRFTGNWIGNDTDNGSKSVQIPTEYLDAIREAFIAQSEPWYTATVRETDGINCVFFKLKLINGIILLLIISSSHLHIFLCWF